MATMIDLINEAMAKVSEPKIGTQVRIRFPAGYTVTDGPKLEELTRVDYARIQLEYQQMMADRARLIAKIESNENGQWVWGSWVSDSGDESAPSEVNPQPIEEVFAKPETEAERNERLWKAIQEFSKN